MNTDQRTSYALLRPIYAQLPSTDEYDNGHRRVQPSPHVQLDSYYYPYDYQHPHRHQQNPPDGAIVASVHKTINHGFDNDPHYPPSIAQARKPVPGPLTRPSNSGMLRILGITIVILILSIGLALGSFSYLFYNRTSWNIVSLQTTVPLGNVLLLFSILSKIAITSIPLVMSITAFHIAGAWMRNQRSERQATGVSPYQYNLVLDIFTGASIFSAWRTLLYICRPTARPNTRHTRRRLSHVLKASITALTALLLIVYVIVGIDFALHHLSIPVLVQKPTHAKDPKASVYGRRLKDECLLRDPTSGAPCTIAYIARFGTEDILYINDYSSALTTLIGTSTTDKVIVADEGQYQIAAFVPADQSVTAGSSFEAQTVGLRVECEPITTRCTHEDIPLTSRTSTCTIDGYPAVRTWVRLSEPSGTMFGHTPDQYSDFVNKSGYNGTDVNPLLFLFSTSMYVGDNLQTSSTADPNGLWHYNSTNSPLSSAVLMCNAIVMDVAFRYAVAENSYSIVSSTPSTNNATIRAVTTILNVLQSPVEDFISVLQPIALSVNTADDFLRAFEKNFAKVYLPFAYSAFEPIPANRVVVSETVQGSSIPTLWLLAYLALLIVLGLFALLHGLSALKVDKTSVWRSEVNGGATTWFGKRSLEQGEWVSIAQLAAERLSAPAALVFEAFERSNGDPDCKTRSLQLGGVEMFKESRKDGIPSSSVGIGVVGEAGSAEARRDAPFGLLCIPPPYESYPSQAILTSDADIGKDRRVLTKREWSTKDA